MPPGSVLQRPTQVPQGAVWKEALMSKKPHAYCMLVWMREVLISIRPRRANEGMSLDGVCWDPTPQARQEDARNLKAQTLHGFS